MLSSSLMTIYFLCSRAKSLQKHSSHRNIYIYTSEHFKDGFNGFII